MPNQSHDQEPRQSSLLTVLQQMLKSFLEVCAPRRRTLRDPSVRARSEAETQAMFAAEDAISSTYANAIFNANAIHERSVRHGIEFSQTATLAHRAAILDFLDNPESPTPLTTMHMTWFNAVTRDGNVTLSKTYPANRARYNFEARYYAAQPLTGNAIEDASLLRIKTVHVPLERTKWTTAQGRQHEEAEAKDYAAKFPGMAAFRRRDPGKHL